MNSFQPNQPNLSSQIFRPEPPKNGSKGISKRYVWIGAAAALIIILALGGLYWRTQHKLSQLNQKTQLSGSDADLLKQVAKLIILPANETPTIATVSDLEKLKGQPFFQNAQVGDKVLIYSTAKKAILYRPSSNQIIELAPLLDGNNNLGSHANTNSNTNNTNTNTPAQ